MSRENKGLGTWLPKEPEDVTDDVVESHYRRYYYEQPYVPVTTPVDDPDRLFTIIPVADEAEGLHVDHEPVLQPRGANKRSLQAQYEDAAERIANAGPQDVPTGPLFNGNFVLDCPIAPRLLDQIPHAQVPERDEFTHTRYSAVTCDPSAFKEQRYLLRPRLYARPRLTRILVGVTMYDEDEVLLGKTLAAVMENVSQLCSGVKSSTIWGEHAWKEIVICIISDGSARLHPRSRALLASLGVYVEGAAKMQVNNREVAAHLYEVRSCRGMRFRGV